MKGILNKEDFSGCDTDAYLLYANVWILCHRFIMENFFVWNRPEGNPLVFYIYAVIFARQPLFHARSSIGKKIFHTLLIFYRKCNTLELSDFPAAMRCLPQGCAKGRFGAAKSSVWARQLFLSIKL